MRVRISELTLMGDTFQDCVTGVVADGGRGRHEDITEGKTRLGFSINGPVKGSLNNRITVSIFSNNGSRGSTSECLPILQRRASPCLSLQKDIKSCPSETNKIRRGTHQNKFRNCLLGEC